jgi:hypothetical protein
MNIHISISIYLHHYLSSDFQTNFINISPTVTGDAQQPTFLNISTEVTGDVQQPNFLNISPMVHKRQRCVDKRGAERAQLTSRSKAHGGFGEEDAGRGRGSDGGGWGGDCRTREVWQ